MVSWRALGAAAGLVADRALGEPGLQPHPVSAFGSVMGAVEAKAWRDDRLAGIVHAGAGLGVGAAAGLVLRSLLGAGLTSTAVATYLAVAGRGLAEAAGDVATALAGDDLDEARRLLPALVGRDPAELDDKDVARAVVESVAENTVDAVVAPAFWAAAAGAPGALAYRAVNTVDAMVGHRSARYRRYGWAGARLDDIAGWLPARLTAGLVAVVRPRAAGEVWRSVRHDAPRHPSPNAGVAEAAFAAALGLRLGGESRYDGRVELRPYLGRGRPPEVHDVARAVRLSSHVATAGTVLLVSGPVAALAWQRRHAR